MAHVTDTTTPGCLVGVDDDAPRRFTGRTALVLLLALVVVDVAVLAGDYLYRYQVPGFTGWDWSADADGGWLEFTGSVQGLLGAGALLAVAVRERRSAVLTAWAVTLVVMVLDDLKVFHERGAVMLEHALTLPAVLGLRTRDVGEMLVWAALALPLLVGLVVCHRRSSSTARATSWAVAGGVLVVAASAVVLDMVTVAATGHVPTAVAYGLSLAEAGGQVIGMSVVLVVALWAAAHGTDGVAASGARLRTTLRRGGPLRAARLREQGRDAD